MLNNSTSARKSKAALTVDIQNTNREVVDGLKHLCTQASCVLNTDAPSKRSRQSLIETAESPFSLQQSVKHKIPDLVPENYTRYSVKRL